MERLYRLFEKHYGCTPVDAVPLTGSASNRQYFRLTDGTRSCVGVVGTMTEENHAFLTMASHFRSKGLPVPEVYSVSEDGMAYIQEDLGDTILYNKVCEDFKTEHNAKITALCALLMRCLGRRYHLIELIATAHQLGHLD